MTDQYLKDQGIASTNETKYLVRGLAGGVVGIVVATYHAAFGNFGDEMKKAIAMANISAFSLWTLSSVNQVVNIATKEKANADMKREILQKEEQSAQTAMKVLPSFFMIHS